MKLNPEMVYRRIGSESVLVPIGKNVDAVRTIYTLNESAAFILELIRAGKREEELLPALAEEYEVGPEAKEWVDGILEDFRANRILL